VLVVVIWVVAAVFVMVVVSLVAAGASGIKLRVRLEVSRSLLWLVLWFLCSCRVCGGCWGCVCRQSATVVAAVSDVV
jgi:hypothetical protein